MPIVSVGDAELFYQERGQGRPIVFMSGVGQTHGFWDAVVDELAGEFHTITFDNRGIGQSDKPVGPYTIEGFREDIHELTDALGLEDFLLVGHSLGALVALEFAMEYPDRLNGLVFSSGLYPGPSFKRWTPRAGLALFNPAGDFETRFRIALDISTAAGFAEKNPGRAKELRRLREEANQSLSAFGWQATSGFGYLNADRVRATGIPMLVLFGEEDEVSVPGNGVEIKKRFPHAELETVTGAGHLLPFEKPDFFAGRIRSFVKSQEKVNKVNQ